MPRSAFATLKAAAEAQAKNEPAIFLLPEAIPIARSVRDESRPKNSNSGSRRKRRKVIDGSTTEFQTPSNTLQLNTEKELIQTTTIGLQTLTQDSTKHHPDVGLLKDKNRVFVSDSSSIPELTESLNQQEYEIIWSEFHQDAEIKLPAGQSLAVVGEYDLWLRKGSISVLGATIHSSSKLYRIYAPQTHAIPLIKALTNPFGPSLQVTEFRLCSASSDIRQLKKCNPRFSRIWHDKQNVVASFQILGRDEADKYPILSIPEDWQRRALEVLEYETPPIVMICGPKNVGKSSFARHLSNSFLSRRYAESGVAYLDLDPGQPEYTTPADLSLIHIKTLNLGPPFTHPIALGDQNNLLMRRHHFGYFSPREDLEHYFDCAADLFNHYRQTLQQFGCPLVINTSGWIHGLGLESTLSLIKRISPTSVSYFASSEVDDENRVTLRQSITKLGIDFAILPTENYPPGPRSAADLRSMQFSSYFHLDTPEYGQHQWNTESLLFSESIVLPYDGKEKVISGVLLLGDQINYDMLEAAIDKTVVALVVIEQSSILHEILHNPSVTECKHIETDDTNMQDGSANEFEAYDDGPDNENLQEIPAYTFSYNKQGVPYLSCSRGVNSPPHPTTTWSMGQVLLNRTDTEEKAFHVHTSIPLHAMRSHLAQGALLILVRGQLGMPEWAYLEEHALFKAIQEDMTELQKLKSNEETDIAVNFDIKSWAQGVDHVEYQDNKGIGGLNRIRRIRRNLGTTSTKS